MFVYTLIDESVNGQNHESLQSLDQLRLAGSDGVFLTHPALHHLGKFITGYGAHSRQQRIRLGQREPPPT